MTKYNVEKIEITNTMTTTLTTSCKKRDTAINRFCRFLSEYDSCFKDSLLIALMTIHFDCFVDDNEMYKSVTETDEYYMTYTECGDVYQVIIEFKHDENTTYYKSLANVSVSDNTNKTATDNDTKDTESDTNDTNKDTNETTETTETIDNTNETTETTETIDNTNDNKTIQQTYNIKAYYDNKEITVPCDKYKCRQYAVEYIKALYENHVVEYETLFNIYHNKHVETITIDKVLDITDLIQYNIDDINYGLKNDYYKKVREGYKRLCNIITDDMKVCFDLHSGNNVYYYTIMKSRFEGLYTFKSDTMCRTQSPESFTRWLYYHTFTHSIELKCWYRDLRGETK